MALRKVGGLWLNERQDGSKYMSGKVSEDIPANTKLLVFKNTYKEAGDNKPDYTLNVADDDQQEPARGQQRRSAPPAEESPF